MYKLLLVGKIESYINCDPASQKQYNYLIANINSLIWPPSMIRCTLFFEKCTPTLRDQVGWRRKGRTTLLFFPKMRKTLHPNVPKIFTKVRTQKRGWRGKELKTKRTRRVISTFPTHPLFFQSLWKRPALTGKSITLLILCFKQCHKKRGENRQINEVAKRN